MRTPHRASKCCLVTLLLSSAGAAQVPDLKLADWQPRSRMVAKQTVILKPKFPVIDIHFMIKYQDRILFGTDTPPSADSYRVYYRFLETDDEYFDPNPAHPYQGRWMVYGLYLPDAVLEKIYNKNALKILSMFKGKP